MEPSASTVKDKSALLQNAADVPTQSPNYGATDKMAASESSAEMTPISTDTDNENDEKDSFECSECLSRCGKSIHDDVCSYVTGCRQGCVEFCEEIRGCCTSVKNYNCGACCKETFGLEAVKRKLPILQWAPKYRYVIIALVRSFCIHLVQ